MISFSYPRHRVYLNSGGVISNNCLYSYIESSHCTNLKQKHIKINWCCDSVGRQLIGYTVLLKRIRKIFIQRKRIRKRSACGMPLYWEEGSRVRVYVLGLGWAYAWAGLQRSMAFLRQAGKIWKKRCPWVAVSRFSKFQMMRGMPDDTNIIFSKNLTSICLNSKHTQGGTSKSTKQKQSQIEFELN